VDRARDERKDMKEIIICPLNNEECINCRDPFIRFKEASDMNELVNGVCAWSDCGECCVFEALQAIKKLGETISFVGEAAASMTVRGSIGIYE